MAKDSFKRMMSITTALFLLLLPSSMASQSGQSQNLLMAWLLNDCEVGMGGVLEAQIAQAGAQLVPGLVQAAQNGPDASTLATVAAGAGQEFDQIQAYLASDGLNSGLPSDALQAVQNESRDEFIADALSDFIYSYQARALVGLGIIGGQTALQVLQSFANNTGSRLQPIAQNALANFAGSTTMAANITAKTGPSDARVWTVTFTNNGPGTAMNVQVNSLKLTQTFGTACTPVVTVPGAFPLSVGSIVPAGTDSTEITINFTGCALNARFKANISFSANSGAVTGTVVRSNQYQ